MDEILTREMTFEAKATILGVAASLAILGVTFALSPLLQAGSVAPSKPQASASATQSRTVVLLSEKAKEGHRLFERNCAHCHGDDARGDEGPSLYDLKKSDARITKLVTQGIKGEMPAFGTKLNDADIQAIIAFLRTLKS
jgi:mono/diheme cytochrome c family protein